MASINKAILVGRLGQAPELKTLPSGNSVCNFSIATSESWLDKNTKQKQEKTEWHRVTVYGKVADNCDKFLDKGSQVYVEGKITTRSWETDKGEKRYSTEINANTVQFLSTNLEKNAALQAATDKADEYKVSTDKSFASEEIPF
jgi:single-strand DNA-binding protein